MKKPYPMFLLAIPVAVATAAVACEDKPNPDAAPLSSALAPAKPKSAASMTFAVETTSSKAHFLMDAPLEKIHGDADGSIAGDVFVDLNDVTKSTGLIKIDLNKLVLSQQKQAKRAKEGEKVEGEFTVKKVDPLQNEHMKNWFEIGGDAPKDQREKNRWVEVKIKSITTKGGKNVNEMKGAKRKVALTLVADVRVHQRTVQKTAEVEAVFVYDGDRPKSVTVKTVKPVNVNLDEHDVRPRTAFGKLAQKTLGDMLQMVASDAPVNVELVAKPKPTE